MFVTFFPKKYFSIEKILDFFCELKKNVDIHIDVKKCVLSIYDGFEVIRARKMRFPGGWMPRPPPVLATQGRGKDAIEASQCANI